MVASFFYDEGMCFDAVCKEVGNVIRIGKVFAKGISESLLTVIVIAGSIATILGDEHLAACIGKWFQQKIIECYSRLARTGIVSLECLGHPCRVKSAFTTFYNTLD